MLWNVYASEDDADKLCMIEAEDESSAIDVALDLWPQYRKTLIVVRV